MHCDARRQTDLITIVNGINGISNGGRRGERTAEGSSLPNWNPIGTSSGVIKMNLALVQFKAATWREFRGTLLIHWIQHQCLSPGRLFMWGKVGGRHQTDPKFRTLLMSAKVITPESVNPWLPWTPQIFSRKRLKARKMATRSRARIMSVPEGNN